MDISDAELRVQPVHLMKREQHQAAADPRPNQSDLCLSF